MTAIRKCLGCKMLINETRGTPWYDEKHDIWLCHDCYLLYKLKESLTLARETVDYNKTLSGKEQ